MKRANKTFLIILTALAITVGIAGCGGGGGGSSSSGGGNPPGTATVSGTLIDTTSHQPLAGVVVSVASTNLTATTSSTGAFSIANVPVGVQTLAFTMNSSSIGSRAISVTAPTSDLGNIDVNTEGNPPPPPPV